MIYLIIATSLDGTGQDELSQEVELLIWQNIA